MTSLSLYDTYIVCFAGKGDIEPLGADRFSLHACVFFFLIEKLDVCFVQYCDVTSYLQAGKQVVVINSAVL